MKNTIQSQNQLVRALVFEPRLPPLPKPNTETPRGGLTSMERIELKFLNQNSDRIQRRIYRIPKEELLF